MLPTEKVTKPEDFPLYHTSVYAPDIDATKMDYCDGIDRALRHAISVAEMGTECSFHGFEDKTATDIFDLLYSLLREIKYLHNRLQEVT